MNARRRALILVLAILSVGTFWPLAADAIRLTSITYAFASVACLVTGILLLVLLVMRARA
jgi:hypothetical protein